MGKFQDITRFLLAAGGSSDDKSTHLFYEENNALLMETWTGSELSNRAQVVAGVRTGTSAPVIDLGYKRVFVADQSNRLRCFTKTLQAEDEDGEEDEDEEEEDEERWEGESLDDVNVILHSKSQLAVSCGHHSILVFYQNPDGTLGAIEDDGEGWKFPQLPTCEAFPGTTLASFQAEDAAYLVYVGTEGALRYLEHSDKEWKDAPFSSAQVDGATAKLSVAKDEKGESNPKLLVFCLADNKLSTIKRESTGVETLGTVKDGVYKPASDQERGGRREAVVTWSPNSYYSAPFASTSNREYLMYGGEEFGEYEPRVTLVMNPLYPATFDPICSDFHDLNVRDRYQPQFPPPPPPYQPPTRPHHAFQPDQYPVYRFDHDEHSDEEPLEEATLQRTAQRPDTRFAPLSSNQRYYHQENSRYYASHEGNTRYYVNYEDNSGYPPAQQQNSGYHLNHEDNSRNHPNYGENSRLSPVPQENTQHPPPPQETLRPRRRPPPPPPPKVEVKEEVKIKEEVKEEDEEDEEDDDGDDYVPTLDPPPLPPKVEPRQPPPQPEPRRNLQQEHDRALHAERERVLHAERERALHAERERALQTLREEHELELQAERERLRAERERVLQPERERVLQSERDRINQAEYERVLQSAERDRALQEGHERAIQALREEHERALLAERERAQAERERHRPEREHARRHRPQRRPGFGIEVGIYVYIGSHRCKRCNRRYQKNREGKWFKACRCLEACERCSLPYRKNRYGLWVRACHCLDVCKRCGRAYGMNRRGELVKTCGCLEACIRCGQPCGRNRTGEWVKRCHCPDESRRR